MPRAPSHLGLVRLQHIVRSSFILAYSANKAKRSYASCCKNKQTNEQTTALTNSLELYAHCFASPVCIYCMAASQRLPPTFSYETADSCVLQTSSDKLTVPVLLHYLPSMKWWKISVNKWRVKSTLYGEIKTSQSKTRARN